VRRCALLAAAAVVSSLPPPRLAGAMLAQQGGAGGGAADGQLVERLAWLRAWAAAAAAGEVDDTCRSLAVGVVGMQAQLASEALQALEVLPGGEGGFDPLAAALAGGGRGAGGGRVSAPVDVRLPSIGQLRLA
jgi:hypothetical protein